MIGIATFLPSSVAGERSFVPMTMTCGEGASAPRRTSPGESDVVGGREDQLAL